MDAMHSEFFCVFHLHFSFYFKILNVVP